MLLMPTSKLPHLMHYNSTSCKRTVTNVCIIIELKRTVSQESSTEIVTGFLNSISINNDIRLCSLCLSHFFSQL